MAASASDLVVFSIGHSTRPIEELLAALASHGIRVLVDVRAFPASRRHPQFGREALERSLPAAGIRYVWMGDTLGGRRRAREDSRHAAIRVEGFRAYADHMETAEFRRGADELVAIARREPTAVMCAEVLWWRCHRSFLADHLVALRGARVVHVRDVAHAEDHRLRKEARLEGDVLVYDGGTLPFGE